MRTPVAEREQVEASGWHFSQREVKDAQLEKMREAGRRGNERERAKVKQREAAQSSAAESEEVDELLSRRRGGEQEMGRMVSGRRRVGRTAAKGEQPIKAVV